MNRSIWRSLTVVFIIVLLSVVLLKSGYTATAEPPPSTTPQATATTKSVAPRAPDTSSQGTEAQLMPARGEPLDDQSLFAKAAQPSSTTPQVIATTESAAPDTSSQGAEAQLMPARGEPLDSPALIASTAATAHFYHIPGSVLMPVDSTTKLVYDLMGCVHASAGASYLLNAPLEIPDGSRIVLLRLYYNDTSASDMNSWITRYDELGTNYEDLVSVPSAGSAGHGSNYGDLDHTVDTYGWSYVLNVRLNVASSTLQVCGLRVMYYPPPGCCTYLPAVMRGTQP
jgi:hypothetical protein